MSHQCEPDDIGRMEYTLSALDRVNILTKVVAAEFDRGLLLAVAVGARGPPVLALLGVLAGERDPSSAGVVVNTGRLDAGEVLDLSGQV